MNQAIDIGYHCAGMGAIGLCRWAYMPGKHILMVLAVDNTGKILFGSIGEARTNVATAFGTPAAGHPGLGLQSLPPSGKTLYLFAFIITSDLHVSSVPSTCTVNPMDTDKL
jgi:hypothetical protein